MQQPSTLTGTLDKACPIIALLAAVGGTILAAHAFTHATNADMAAVISRLLLTSVSFLGFTITGLSILVAVPGREFGQKLRKSGHFDVLVTDAAYAIRFFFGAVICGLVSLLGVHLMAFIAACAMTALLAAALVYAATAGNHFIQVLRHI